MKKREGEISQGKLPWIYFDKIIFDNLADDFLMDYRINQKKSLDKAERRVNHLKKHFEVYPVPQITTPNIQAYIESRLEEGAANATINRGLSALKRMLNLGARQTPPKVDHDSYIPLLKENNVRKGFFEHAEFVALRAELSDYLKGFITFAFKTGWRLSNVTGLTWNQGIAWLESGETKNDEGRKVYLEEELQEVFNHQWELRKKSRKLTPYVFPNIDDTNRISDFRGSWNKA